MSKKSTPTHETRSFEAEVILDDKNKKRLRILNQKYFDYEVKHFPIGQRVQIKVTSKKPLRSAQQNNFYHLYLSLISLSSGHSVGDLKEWVKMRFLSKGISEIFGDKIRKVNSTAKLTRGEFVELLCEIEAKTGVPLPDPAPFNLGLTHEEYAILKKRQADTYKNIKPEIK